MMAQRSEARLDAVLAALADPTRRTIIERLIRRGEMAVGEVAAPFRISAPAISRHLRVLERAGLIERRAQKQWRMVCARPAALRPVESWLARTRRHWEDALDRLAAFAAADQVDDQS